MIVKNESEFIEKCLNSIKGIIDYWVICDTGSTDGTQGIIKNIFKDVPGELHERKWINFGANRNESLELAKKKCDYVLLLDADWEVKGSLSKELSSDAYYLKDLGETWYKKTILIRSELDWKYFGSIHEYVSCSQKIKEEQLDIKITDSRRCGGKEKIQHYLELLQKEFFVNPNDPRTVFYLAQSYKDLGNWVFAERFYHDRYKMGGWEEEAWYSLYQMARMIEFQGKEEKIIVQSYLDAYCNRPKRAEPLYELCRYFRMKKKFAQGYVYGMAAVGIEFPYRDTLFVEKSIYNWKIKDELSICCYYCGMYKEALNFSNQISIENERIKSNREYFIHGLEGLEAG